MQTVSVPEFLYHHHQDEFRQALEAAFPVTLGAEQLQSLYEIMLAKQDGDADSMEEMVATLTKDDIEMAQHMFTVIDRNGRYSREGFALRKHGQGYYVIYPITGCQSLYEHSELFESLIEANQARRKGEFTISDHGE